MIALPPYARRAELAEQVVFDYYQSIATAGRLPVFVQNYVPPLGLEMSPAFMLRMCREIEHVDYIKEETVPSTTKMTELLAADDGMCLGVFGGAGGRYVVEEHRRGAAGNMPCCHVADIVVGLWNALEQGEREVALSWYRSMAPLSFFENQLPGIYKEVLKRRGVTDSAHKRNGPLVLDQVASEYLDEILESLRPLMSWKSGRASDPALSGRTRDRQS